SGMPEGSENESEREHRPSEQEQELPFEETRRAHDKGRQACGDGGRVDRDDERVPAPPARDAECSLAELQERNAPEHEEDADRTKDSKGEDGISGRRR